MYKSGELPMDYSSQEEVYIDKLWFMIYKLGNKIKNLKKS